MTIDDRPAGVVSREDMEPAERALFDAKMAQTGAPHKLLDIPQAARRLGVMKSTVYGWRNDERAPHPSYIPPADDTLSNHPGWFPATLYGWGEQTGKLRWKRVTDADRAAETARAAARARAGEDGTEIQFDEWDFVPTNLSPRLASVGKPRRPITQAATARAA